MKTIHVNQKLNQPLIAEFNGQLKGIITSSKNGQSFDFKNEDGEGKIREYFINNNLKLLTFELFFDEKTKLLITNGNSKPIDFIYVFDGSISFVPDNLKERSHTLETYQNVIIKNKPKFNNSFIIPAKTKVQFQIIEVLSEDLISNRNLDIYTIEEKFKELISDIGITPFIHTGNFNLRIKDLLEQDASNDNKFVEFLILKGKVYLVLAEQLSAYQRYLDEHCSPSYISPQDLVNLKVITEDINANLSEFRNIADICAKHGYSQPKLQTLFKMFYDKTINEYIKYQKMELARDLIKNTNFNISEIVYQIGYKSRSYFSKLFFESYGILPMEFKEKCRAEDYLAQRKNR